MVQPVPVTHRPLSHFGLHFLRAKGSWHMPRRVSGDTALVSAMPVTSVARRGSLLRFLRAKPRGLWSFCRKPTGSHRSPRSSVPAPHGVSLMRVMRFCLSPGRSGDLVVVPCRVAGSCPRLGTPGLSPPCSHSLSKIEHALFLLQLCPEHTRLKLQQLRLSGPANWFCLHCATLNMPSAPAEQVHCKHRIKLCAAPSPIAALSQAHSLNIRAKCLRWRCRSIRGGSFHLFRNAIQPWRPRAVVTLATGETQSKFAP